MFHLHMEIDNSNRTRPVSDSSRLPRANCGVLTVRQFKTSSLYDSLTNNCYYKPFQPPLLAVLIQTFGRHSACVFLLENMW